MNVHRPLFLNHADAQISNTSTRLWFYYIITKIHPPFQNPGSAPASYFTDYGGGKLSVLSFSSGRCNPCSSFPILTILVPLEFIIISFVFFLLSKLLFSGILPSRGGGGGGGGTPLYGLYRCVPQNRVWFLEVLDP